MTQKEMILAILKKNRKWTPSFEIIKTKTPYGYLGTSADRRARELRESGDIESQVKNRDGVITVYFRLKKKEGRGYGKRAIAG